MRHLLASSAIMTFVEWEKLAVAVRDRRRELGFRTREAFAEATDLSPRVLGDIENARRDNYDTKTIQKLEAALQWARGRVLDLLRGGLAEREASPEEPPELQTAEGIARYLYRDDLPLVALLHRSGLREDQIFTLILRVRAIRERQHMELLTDVAEQILKGGGWAPEPVHPVTWLSEEFVTGERSPTRRQDPPDGPTLVGN
jgi:hypothetical protein